MHCFSVFASNPFVYCSTKFGRNAFLTKTNCSLMSAKFPFVIKNNRNFSKIVESFVVQSPDCNWRGENGASLHTAKVLLRWSQAGSFLWETMKGTARIPHGTSFSTQCILSAVFRDWRWCDKLTEIDRVTTSVRQFHRTGTNSGNKFKRVATNTKKVVYQRTSTLI